LEKSVQAVHNLRAAGIHTHTNTTVCGGNRQHLIELVDFIADELHSEYFSMNMVIRTGTALDHAQDDIRYTEIGPIIEAVQAHAQVKGVRLVWYSPVPYCLFNPVQAGLGSKSCACVDGLISVNPAGELLLALALSGASAICCATRSIRFGTRARRFTGAAKNSSPRSVSAAQFATFVAAHVRSIGMNVADSTNCAR
jgi:hypothetical protein